MSTGRATKEPWTAELPPFRDGAVGRLHHGTVFLLSVLQKDPARYIRLEIPSSYARALATELIRAAEKADEHHRVAS